MAHQFESGFFVGKTAWHGLGTTLPADTSLSVSEGLAAAGLNWRVGILPLDVSLDLDPPDLPTGEFHPLAGERTDARVTYRESDNTILGVVGKRYEPLQNIEAFEWFQPFLDSEEASLHTAGSLHDGKRVWVLAKLNRRAIEVTDGDLVEKYLLLSNSHDGSTCVRVGFCPIRVVCANTLSMAHQAGQLLRLRHTASLKATLDDVRDIVNTANASFEATAQQYQLLATRAIERSDVTKYVKQVVLEIDPETSWNDLTTRKQNILTDVLSRYEQPVGGQYVELKPTWWRAYNAVTEHLSYSSGRNQNSRLQNLWYGTGHKRSQQALSTALRLSS